MKVKIGKYPQHRFYHNWLYALGWTNLEKVSVRIDPWDTWSMDSTLAHIVVPMLKQLRDTSHGAPFVEDQDRPEHLIGTVANKEIGDIDEFHFQAWDWVLTEMLFAFESKHNDSQYNWSEHYNVTPEEYISFKSLVGEWKSDDWIIDKACQVRITNGFRLFGKYYENLWD